MVLSTFVCIIWTGALYFGMNANVNLLSLYVLHVDSENLSVGAAPGRLSYSCCTDATSQEHPL
jgi:hypothetical protein